MLVAIAINNSAHQQQHGRAIQRGFERHGIKAVFTQGDTVVPDADIHVVWSIKKEAIMAWSENGLRPVLVMERGHLGDRMKYTSCGWNGLGRRGQYPAAPNGERWQKLWSHLLEPWRDTANQRALLIGQIEGDAALYNLRGGFHQWTHEQTRALRALGYTVIFRPHPLNVRLGYAIRAPFGAELSRHKSLAEDLKSVSLAVTFNSTAGVECVLAGVPTVTLDQGAMAWDVSSHQLKDVIRPDREAWAIGLSYTQWDLQEIELGEAWANLQPLYQARMVAA